MIFKYLSSKNYLKMDANNFLLIDSAYCIFNAKRYISRKLCYNEENFDTFTRLFKNNIRKNIFNLIRTKNIPLKNIIFVRDGSRDELWRSKLWKSSTNQSSSKKTYKKKNNSYKKYDYLLFKEGYNFISNFFVDILHCKILRSNTLEADDLISGWVHLNNSNLTKIMIVGVDKDLFQLKKYKNVSFLTITGKDIDIIAEKWMNKIVFNNNSLFQKIGKKMFINLNFDIFPNNIKNIIIDLV